MRRRTGNVRSAPTEQNGGGVGGRIRCVGGRREGRKRRDSVWMGTDALSMVRSRQPEGEQPEESWKRIDDDSTAPEAR